MRKSIALKTLLRAPVKMILTFLLIAAASFALFFRVTDYAVTTREAAKAESFYSGVAALDNSVVPVVTDEGYYIEPEPKAWPTDEQIKEFSSLPGVTLTDTRYITDGLVENYKRVIDQEESFAECDFVVEGTYDGYEEYDVELKWSNLYLVLHDVTVHAGDIELNPDHTMKIKVGLQDDYFYHVKEQYPKSYFDTLKKGSRYLILGYYSERSGTAFELDRGYTYHETDFLREIDGLGEDYLETEEFAEYKGIIEATNQRVMAYDMVYTADMRAIPFVNEHKIIISQGRPLTGEDTDSCVVSEDFLAAYGLSVGDKIHVQLGDRLLGHHGNGGTRFRTAEEMSDFIASAELEIIGAYRFNSDYMERRNNPEWSYGPGTIFVPHSLLPVIVPDDHEVDMGEFSLFIQDPNDTEAFREAAEPLAAELDLALRFSDGGWSGMKDSIETGSLTSFLTTVLYVLGAALALFLAVYLYVGRNQESYAIMRTLGVSGKKAGNSITLPFLFVLVFAMAIGGMAGLFYASRTVAKTLASMSGSTAPERHVYVLDGAIPVEMVVFCLVFELAFAVLLILFFLGKMKKTSPLELLHKGTGRTTKRAGIWRSFFTASKQVAEIADAAPVPAGLDMARFSVIEGVPVNGKYNAFHQVSAYVLRHMKRGIGKTAVSLVLTVVLAAGIGTFALARLTYREAYREAEVKGTAVEFASSSIAQLAKSDLIKDFYYYSRLDVRVNGDGTRSAITFTNDLDKYLRKDYKVIYAEGYDESIFDGTGEVCLVEQALAERLGIKAGDDITMMSEDLYNFMPQIYEEDEIEDAVWRAGKQYKVTGILETEDADKGAGIFTVINDGAQRLYGQPFPVGYCEFTLADTGKLTELSSLLEELKAEGMEYAKMASFHVDSEILKNTKRVRDLLESLFPIAVAAAVLIGLFGPWLIIMQSAQEAAFLRILGVTKKRARCILVLEQMVLCIAGIVLVAGILAIFSPELFIRSIKTISFCWMLYFLGNLCGAFVAAVEVTRHRVLELLQVRE